MEYWLRPGRRAFIGNRLEIVMSLMFEELDYQQTPLGAVSLRRRCEPAANNELIYEVKLGEEFLMSSLFTVGERALAANTLARIGQASMNVVVGGLGLGYTAWAALECTDVASLVVVEALAPVIDWHQRALVPLGGGLVADRRCRFVEGDFFALAADVAGFDPDQPGRRFDAILLDIDHAPDHHLSGAHGAFYTSAGLTALSQHLAPGGAFAMWSNDPPAPAFLRTLGSVFSQVEAERVMFPNPYTGVEASCSIYYARA